MKIQRRTLLLLAFELFLVLAIVFAVNLWRTRDSVTGMAPALVATTLNGETFDLHDHLGESILVHFWASWCPICGFVDGSVDAIAKQHPVITVALSSGTDAEIHSHLADEGLTFNVINDADGSISREWGVVGVPMSFIIDARGEVRFTEVGLTSGPGLRLRLWLANHFDFD